MKSVKGVKGVKSVKVVKVVKRVKVVKGVKGVNGVKGVKRDTDVKDDLRSENSDLRKDDLRSRICERLGHLLFSRAELYDCVKAHCPKEG
jgi:hypothetical protein